MKKLKIFAMLAILLASMFVSAVSAQDFDEQLPVYVDRIWINDKEVDWMCFWNDNTMEYECGEEIRGDIERGDNINVEVRLAAEEDIDGIEVEVSVKGYEHGRSRKTSESTDLFDVKEGRTYYKDLDIELPQDLDYDNDGDDENENVYALRIEVSDKYHREEVWNVLLEINTPRHKLNIDDVLFSPGQTVQAGRSLLTSVRVENFGQRDEDNVKVTFTIPELGVADYDYIEEVEVNDEKMTEELFVRIPADAENKDYEAKVVVDYDDGYKTVEETFVITVIGGTIADDTVEKTVLTVGPETQNVVAGGSEAIYPIAITNAGTESRTYSLSLITGDWSNSRLSENVLVIGPEETKVAYAYVAANKDAAAGEKVIGLAIMSGDETLKEVSLKANVVNNENSWDTVKKGLEIGLVVLVILLVIIGLIIGFSRLKNKDEEDEDEDKTYY
ncbi:MAG: hypothetical protein KAT77_01635 [Nanoarchaeota archaeon]|nr:hypothetical protein [Nanoarchaeota archaeon]